VKYPESIRRQFFVAVIHAHFLHPEPFSFPGL
jgi:hypothetical protein